jgi:hypothetical protein
MSIDQSAPKTIDDYIAAFPQEMQAVLQQIRQVIHETLSALPRGQVKSPPAST